MFCEAVLDKNGDDIVGELNALKVFENLPPNAMAEIGKRFLACEKEEAK